MERDGDDIIEENCLTNGHFEGEPFLFTSKVFLDNVGEVIICFSSTGLSWKSADSLCDEKSPCLGRVFRSESAAEIYFSDVYATKLIGWGVIQQPAGCCFLHQDLEMHRFVVHGMQKSKANPSLWQLVEYTFGHKNQPVCQMLVDQITAHLNKEMGRPKSLLVFVNPKSGKGNGQKIWEGVAPIFSRAEVKAQVTVTERAGHAFDLVASMTSHELNTYDGIVAVGGDGLFNEILNGLTTSRFKGKCPPVPPGFLSSTEKDLSDLVFDPPNEAPAGTEETSCSTGDDVGFSIPHKWFRLGLIPGGSTDAIVICTTGVRDPTTSALHIVLGKRIGLDIAQVVRWKATNTSKVEPLVRYTASFVGYGFYGDVITESEKYRWMGPKRYDVAGTQVFLRHKSYEAEVSYLDLKYEETTQHLEEGNLKVGTRSLKNQNKKREREICRTNCEICCMPSPSTSEPKWLSAKGRYLSVGAAVISCRNERAPDGLVADAHLSDGLLHLILIKNCPHPSYLWHLTHLARKGGSPLDFKFVEHHKTPAFVFTSVGKEGVWNLDGEILHAHKLSAQVFRGLVNLFAAGPEN